MTDLTSQAAAASNTLSFSELHGLVCGFSSGRPNTFSLPDFVELVGEDALTTDQAVAEFVGTALKGFAAEDLEFEPLIDDDGAPLGQRVDQLSIWCAGFLSGFGASAPASSGSTDALPTEVQEILRDFASISGLSADEEDPEEDLSAFEEIFEFVKVAALLVFATMRAAQPADKPSDPVDS